MDIFNIIYFRQSEKGWRELRLFKNGEPFDLTDATEIKFQVENENGTGLYVDATCDVVDASQGKVKFQMAGTEFAALVFGDTTEFRLRAICWVSTGTAPNDTRSAFPEREGAVAVVASKLPRSG